MATAALLLILTACGSDDALAIDIEDCEGPPQVTVNDSGAEPRELMELSPTAGHSAGLDVAITTGVSARRDGEDVPLEAPPTMRFGIELVIENVTDDEIEMSFVYDDAELGGDLPMDDMLESITGTSGFITTTRSGAFVDGGFMTEEMDPLLVSMVEQLDQQMVDMTVPFPEEPVGVGAEWQVVSSVDGGGVTFCNKASYVLTDFDGDAYQLDTEITQQAIPTTQGSDTGIDVVGGSGSFTGQSAGTLSLPIAVSGTSNGTTSVEMKLGYDETETTHEYETAVEMEIAPRS
ncbi:hypothetical protein [Phytoactinopolyspora mesophila]|uniref:hypothetical protein n=1 Tax=Phytoactinopolyspora mesophila TaxID=2650750 RepID=UPI001C9E7CD0|nr:hypothetical protein [Phytoactinopolyspora mesophila]